MDNDKISELPLKTRCGDKSCSKIIGAVSS
jgi:hypothetical protein